jgi:hypothetical protein
VLWTFQETYDAPAQKGRSKHNSPAQLSDTSPPLHSATNSHFFGQSGSLVLQWDALLYPINITLLLHSQSQISSLLAVEGRISASDTFISPGDIRSRLFISDRPGFNPG